MGHEETGRVGPQDRGEDLGRFDGARAGRAQRHGLPGQGAQLGVHGDDPELFGGAEAELTDGERERLRPGERSFARALHRCPQQLSAGEEPDQLARRKAAGHELVLGGGEEASGWSKGCESLEGLRFAVEQAPQQVVWRVRHGSSKGVSGGGPRAAPGRRGRGLGPGGWGQSRPPGLAGLESKNRARGTSEAGRGRADPGPEPGLSRSVPTCPKVFQSVPSAVRVAWAGGAR